jgi:hypothetical protein
MIFVVRLDMDEDLCDARRRPEDCILDHMSDTVPLGH